MERLKRTLAHQWHCALNRHSAQLRQDTNDWPRFMYEAKGAADEVPRMAILFKKEREGGLPTVHQQCSMQDPVPVEGNHLKCCLGVKAKECPHLIALEQMAGVDLEEIDEAKAWTCATHIISKGGDMINEGYMLTVDDRMYWDNVYASLAACEEG